MKTRCLAVCLLLIGLWGCDGLTSAEQASEEGQVGSGELPQENTLAVEANSSLPTDTDSYALWQREAGFFRPDRYEAMPAQQLEEMSRAGDRFASQRLGELAWENYSDRDLAVSWLKKSAEQGSVAALSQAAMMFDPDSDALLVKAQQGFELEGNRVDAYVWARLAALRGDPDAVFGVQKHAEYLTSKQVTELELLALEEYQLLQKAHFRYFGRGFENSFPIDANAPHNQIIARDN